MIKMPGGVIATIVSAVFTFTALSFIPSAAVAKDEPKPKPSVDCSKQKNRNHPKCKGYRELSDDELYFAGYWLARRGEHRDALFYLQQSRNVEAPRVLTYIGFSLRKLGQWDEAMGYYARALQIDPNYTVARAYLGEAMLQKGDLVRARDELQQIELRCGSTCGEYGELKDAIAKFESDGQRGAG